MSKQPTLVLAPVTIPSLPSIGTPHIIPPKPLSSVLGCSKRSFHIDAKRFSFSFDGGRSDSYALHETRRNVKSSIWVGRRGLEWILTCLEDIQDWVPGHGLLCKRFRENGKLLEFCGRSNKVGLFVVVTVYFGGSRRGCITIPASSNRASWSLFQKELRNFCFGANPVSLAKVSLNNGGGGGKLVGGSRSGKSMSVYGNKQKIRNFETYGAKWGQNMIHGVSFENGSAINGNGLAFSGKPMRAFKFKLTPAFLALRVCKPEGGRRVVTCLSVEEISWLKDLCVGPEVTKQSGGLDEAQPVVHVPSLKEGSLVKPSYLKLKSDAQSTWVLDKSTRGLLSGDSELPESAAVPDLELSASALNVDPVQGASMVSPSVCLKGAYPGAVVSAMVAQPVADSIGKDNGLLAHVYELEFDGCTLMEASGALGAESGMESGHSLSVLDPDSDKVGSSDMLDQWVQHNHFSPLSKLGNEMGTEFGEGEDQIEAFSDYHEAVVQPRPVASGGLSHIDSRLLLECNPLTWWDPNTLGEMVMVEDDTGGAQVAESESNSSWVSQLMIDFCNVVGFPIVKHKAHCLALFRLLE